MGVGDHGCLEIALPVGGTGDFNCSDDDPEDDKEGAEKQETFDDFLDP